MSHAQGEVIKDGKVRGYFEYNGTVDVACTAIQRNPEAIKQHWRSPTNCRDCSCSQPRSDVILWTSYGGGFWWPSTACFSCMAITGNRDPWREEAYPEDGYPIPEAKEKEPAHA